MRWHVTLLTSALIGALALSGCQSTSSSWGSGAEADPRLQNDDFSVSWTSYAASCATGAALTGLTCLLITDSDQHAACIAAAAAGCAIGMGTNALLDELRSNYHTKEQQLDALITQLEDDRQKAVYMAATANQVYAEDKAKLAALNKNIKSHQAQKSEIEQRIAYYDANIAVLQDNLDYHQKALASYQEARTGLASEGRVSNSDRAKLKECDRQIAQLEDAIESIRGAMLSYTEDRNVLNLTLENYDQVGTRA